MQESPIAEYYEQIKTGKINACKEIKTIYKHLNKKLTDESDGYHYDAAKAERCIEFCERFCHLPKVKGNPLVKLMLWQRAMIAAIMGFVDEEGHRQYNEVMLEVGRKNAKSTIAGMIALYLLVADGEAEPEIYSTATKKDQAKIMWQAAVDIVHKSEDLRKYCKCRVSDIFCSLNHGVFKPLASDSNSLDGLNSSVIICDEIHAYKDANLYSVMVDSTAARVQPLTLLTTTAGFVREGLFDQKMEEYQQILADIEESKLTDYRRLPLIYKLDSATELYDMKSWIKANPGLGEIRSLSKLAEDVERTRSSHHLKKDVLVKFFNLPQSAQSRFLSIEECTNEATFHIEELKPRYCIGGFDLSQVNDLTAAVALFKVRDDPTLYVLSQAWMPEDSFADHMRTDRVPYDLFIEKGWLRLCRGNKIDYHDIADWFVDVQQRLDVYVYKIGYDRYSASYLTQEIEQRLGKNILVPVAQGSKTLSLPLQHLKAALAKKSINYNNNQLMRWCLLNLSCVQDINGNYNTVKNRSEKVRDDLAMALLDAMVVYYEELDAYENMI